MQKTSQKIQDRCDKYDTLISYLITDDQLFALLIRIVRYFNAGNSDAILSNQTAYFQTEVIFDADEKVK